jgi:hypothetical protein
MKISYRTHPMLECLSGRHISFGRFSEKDTIPEIVEHSLDYLISQFVGLKLQPKYITGPFREEITFSRNKMLDDSLVKTISNEYGVFVERKYVTFYHLATNQMMVFVFLDRALVFSHLSGVKADSLFVSDYFTKYFPDPTVSEAEMMLDVVSAVNFIKYAQIKTKYLEPKKRLKDINCKYVNDTSLKIQILDETYYTQYIKSGAFGVRGHFRMQPKKKDGQWTKEMIWINEFQKEGYTRKAGKLNEYPES